MLVEQIQMLNIFDGLQRAIGILIVVAILVYLFYTILSIRYVPKKESGP
jgi:capsular polysaccharide biosynthesis protein